jgi:quercetin dioxygenase-like cupin family protein
MEPVSAGNAEHYIWGDSCDGWRLVGAEGLSVIEERMPPGTQEHRHRHQRARQFFYVLQGELTMELEGAVHRLPARRGLEIPAQAAHQARNDSAEEVWFLVVSAPPGQGDRIPA